ncbi:MAG: type I 3-dehydroquinate dehydratase [Psychrobacillus sp.]
MKIVSIRDIHIGEGLPKVIVPLIGKDKDFLLNELLLVKKSSPDIVEWRVDFLQGVESLEVVKDTLSYIRNFLYPIPLLFTFRSHKEGGSKVIKTAYYKELLREIIQTKEIDLVDIELFSEDVEELVALAKDYEISVVMSSHDFQGTPSKEVIIDRLKTMQKLGADIPKIAVMPNNPADVLTLLDATYTMYSQYAERPIITMSMAKAGIISRLSGEIFGSAATFGSGVSPSAPGQIEADELRRVLGLLHNA